MKKTFQMSGKSYISIFSALSLYSDVNCMAIGYVYTIHLWTNFRSLGCPEGELIVGGRVMVGHQGTPDSAYMLLQGMFTSFSKFQVDSAEFPDT